MATSFRPLLASKPLVGIFGNGLSGKGVAHLCEKLHLPYEIIDERQQSQIPHFERYGLCVFSPGFSPNHPWRQRAEAADVPSVTELDFAASCFSNPVIAVTGTNGKTSVTEILTLTPTIVKLLPHYIHISDINKGFFHRIRAWIPTERRKGPPNGGPLKRPGNQAQGFSVG